MQWQYWRVVHSRAAKEARNYLGIETRKRLVIKLLLVIVAIAFIWLIGGREMAGNALIVRIALTTAVIAIFPAVYCWEFVTTPAKMQAEADARIKQLEQTQATLVLSGPHKFKDHNYQNQLQWRMKIHNAGPAPADNVQLKLAHGNVGPKDPAWKSDYPYSVVHVGAIGPAKINQNTDESYEIICGWKSEAGPFFTRLETRSHNPIQMLPEERWQFLYEVNSSNAAAIHFTLEIFIESDEVRVIMVN